MHEAWQTHQMNRYYDERFMGRIYQFRSQLSPNDMILVAELRVGTELYLSQEFDDGCFAEAALYLDQVYEAATLTSREESHHE